MKKQKLKKTKKKLKIKKDTSNIIIGIFSIIFGILVPIIGLILSIIAIKKGDKNKDLKILGQTGLLLSIVFIAIWVDIICYYYMDQLVNDNTLLSILGFSIPIAGFILSILLVVKGFITKAKNTKILGFISLILSIVLLLVWARISYVYFINQPNIYSVKTNTQTMPACPKGGVYSFETPESIKIDKNNIHYKNGLYAFEVNETFYKKRLLGGEYPYADLEQKIMAGCINIDELENKDGWADDFKNNGSKASKNIFNSVLNGEGFVKIEVKTQNADIGNSTMTTQSSDIYLTGSGGNTYKGKGILALQNNNDLFMLLSISSIENYYINGYTNEEVIRSLKLIQ